MLGELKLLPVAPQVDRVPLRDTDFAVQYSVRLTSIGPYRLFAYISIPTGTPPHPVIYHTPLYGSVVPNLIQGWPNLLRRDHVILVLAARGQRNADRPYTASFPGLLTEGIEEASSYAFRGIVADSVRGLEYLLSRDDVDAGRVALVGNDVALMTASVGDGATHLICTPDLFHKTVEIASGTEVYPLEEINDFIRFYPEKRGVLEQTLSYYDLRWFAQSLDTKNPRHGRIGRERLSTSEAFRRCWNRSVMPPPSTNRHTPGTSTACSCSSGWLGSSASASRSCRSPGNRGACRLQSG